MLRQSKVAMLTAAVARAPAPPELPSWDPHDAEAPSLEEAVHPILMDYYARDRHADMLRTAELWRAARERQDGPRQRRGPAASSLPPARGGPRLSPRRRLGWLLVVVGLRLAVGARGQLPRP